MMAITVHLMEILHSVLYPALYDRTLLSFKSAMEL